MIIWGGNESLVTDNRAYVNSGGRYDPAADTWVPVSIDMAPSGRINHTSVWADVGMIVWGGWSYLSSGGLYALHQAADLDVRKLGQLRKQLLQPVDREAVFLDVSRGVYFQEYSRAYVEFPGHAVDRLGEP